jgi:hypothetical protein
MKLVADWRQAHHWRSVQFAGLGALFTGIGVGASYATSAMALLPVMSFRAVCAIALLIFLCVIAGRVIDQKPAKQDDTDQAGA